MSSYCVFENNVVDIEIISLFRDSCIINNNMSLEFNIILQSRGPKGNNIYYHHLKYIQFTCSGVNVIFDVIIFT